MPEQKDEMVIHPLLTREIRPISNWHEWLTLWQTAENVQWMESLLHVGFDILFESRYGERIYDHVDRCMFYFAMADGWADHYLLRLQEDEGKQYPVGQDSAWNIIRKTPSELRQQLARKAFDMLCMNFFKVELKRDNDDGRFKAWEVERLLPVIQNFFRLEELQFRNIIEIRNLSCRNSQRSHNEQQAVNFLLSLAKFLWEWEEPDISYSHTKDEEKKRLAAMRTCLDAAKPWMTEVLSTLDRLDVLRSWILKLDETCLTRLREIALHNELNRFEHLVVESRPVKTLDEACFLESRTAWFLKEYELKVREHKRLSMIFEAEQQKAEADREIARLSGK